MSQDRFSISWTVTPWNCGYKVSIPKYDGGEVVKAEVYDELQRKYDATKIILADLQDAVIASKRSLVTALDRSLDQPEPKGHDRPTI